MQHVKARRRSRDKTLQQPARPRSSTQSDKELHVMQAGGKWIIAANFRPLRDRGRSYTIFDVWDGNNWWAQVALAMTFETQAEADARLAMDRFRM